jgi:hypothetical protein
MTDEQSAAGRALVAMRWAREVAGVCAQCGRSFVGKSGQRYCSARCRWAHNNDRRRAQRHQQKS